MFVSERDTYRSLRVLAQLDQRESSIVYQKMNYQEEREKE